MSDPKVAPTGAPVVCTDLTEVDLKPFELLPKPQDLPETSKASQEVAAFYNEVAIFHLIDDQYGNKDGKLQKEDLDKFFKKNPSKDPQANSCEVLKEARLFASQVPVLVGDLKKTPDLSPVDLAPFYSLPDLKKFVELPETQDPDVFKAQIDASGISPEIKKLILTDEGVQARYFTAKSFIRADQDKDGKLSVSDIETLLKANNLPINNPEFSPAVILGEARQMAPQTAMFGFQIRKQYGLLSDSNSIDLMWLIGIAQIAPSFLESDKRLNALLQSVARKNDKGQYELTAEAQDLVLTKEEFLKNPTLPALRASWGYTSDEALFAELKRMEETLQMPIYLWPKDLQEKIKNAGAEVMESVAQMQAINDDQRRAELILGFLEAVSTGKFEQEKLDHSGSAGGFLSDVTYVVSLGNWSWNDQFQNKYPDRNRKQRDEAIEALRTTLRERRLHKVEDGIAYMQANGQGGHVSVLKSECDVDRWVKVANTQDEMERAKALREAATAYREGTYKFWENPIIPLPRLGSGGFFNRASSLSNWTWKSPEIPVTLSINNFLSTKTPNNWTLFNKEGAPFLLTQLGEEDRKTFEGASEKAKKGEAVDVKAIDAMLAKSPLTQEGRDTLKAYFQAAIIDGENGKVVQDFSKQAFVQKLVSEKDKDKAAEAKLVQIDQLFGAVAGGIVTAEKAGQEVAMLYLDEADAKVLKEYLAKIKHNPTPKDINGVETLFREAQFGDNYARARELFNKASHIEPEKVDFNQIVSLSKLSEDNKKILSVAFDQQPMTLTISQPAEKEFLEILGYPKINPMTGSYDPKSVGNLHNGMRTTVDRVVGGFMLGGPTIAGAGIGYSLGKATPWKAGLGGGVSGAAMGYILSDGKDTKTRFAYTAIGAGAGWATTYGIARLFKAKGFNPWWGAGAGALIGSMIYITPGGQKWASQSWEIMQMPYRPWSDLSVMSMPSEFINLYADFYIGGKAMEGILTGAKMFGAMEVGDKIAKLLRVTPGVVKVGGMAALGSGMGYLTSDKKEGNTARNMVIGGILGGTLSLKKKWPFGAAMGGTIGYAGSDHKDWRTDVRRTATGMFIGGTLFYGAGKLFKGKTPWGVSKADSETVAPWVKEQMTMLETQITREEAALAMGKGEGATFKFSDEVIAFKEGNIARLKELAKAYETLGKANNHLSITILNNTKKMLGEAEGMMKMGGESAALGEARLVQAERMLLAGSHELTIQGKMLISNSRLSRLLLVGVVGYGVDKKMMPPTPLVPPFKEDFNGNPRPKAAVEGNF